MRKCGKTPHGRGREMLCRRNFCASASQFLFFVFFVALIRCSGNCTRARRANPRTRASTTISPPSLRERRSPDGLCNDVSDALRWSSEEREASLHLEGSKKGTVGAGRGVPFFSRPFVFGVCDTKRAIVSLTCSVSNAKIVQRACFVFDAGGYWVIGRMGPADTAMYPMLKVSGAEAVACSPAYSMYVRDGCVCTSLGLQVRMFTFFCQRRRVEISYGM